MATLARPAARRIPFPLLRGIGVASTAGALAGMLIGGLGSRLAMRISGAMSDPAMIGIARTDNGNVLGEITLGGTLALVIFGGLLPGIVAGVLYMAVRPWLRPLGRWAGLGFGLLLLAALASLVLEPFNIDFRKFGSPPVNVAVFTLLFPLFGLALGALFDLLDRRSRADSSSALNGLWLIGLGVALLGVAPFMISSLGSLITGDRADLRPLIPAYWLLAAVALRWVFSRGREFTDVRELPRRDALLSSLALVWPSVAALPATVGAITFLSRP